MSEPEAGQRSVARAQEFQISVNKVPAFTEQRLVASFGERIGKNVY